jgi:hypothetical protein
MASTINSFEVGRRWLAAHASVSSGADPQDRLVGKMEGAWAGGQAPVWKHAFVRKGAAKEFLLSCRLPHIAMCDMSHIRRWENGNQPGDR